MVINGAIALLFFSTMFFSFRVFVEAELLSKSYAFIVATIIFSITTIWMTKQQRLHVDTISITVLSLIGYLLIMTFLSPLKSSNVHILMLITFISLYRLMLLYKTSNQEEKAILIAQEILVKPVKINSSIVSHIKKIAKDMIDKCSMLQYKD